MKSAKSVATLLEDRVTNRSLGRKRHLWKFSKGTKTKIEVQWTQFPVAGPRTDAKKNADILARANLFPILCVRTHFNACKNVFAVLMSCSFTFLKYSLTFINNKKTLHSLTSIPI